MRAAVVVFPGSNCDRDLAVAFRQAGARVEMVWHKDSDLPDGVDIVGIPGGFSFGDYLRCGAIAARSPICEAIVAHANRGGYALGICNGFQVLTETGLLPGALLRNSGLEFACRVERLRVEDAESVFTEGYEPGSEVAFPIAHVEGNYYSDERTLDELEAEGRVPFRYARNPNGSRRDIAGVLSRNRRILGLMPHPERAADPVHGSADGAAMFKAIAGAVAVK